MNIKEKISLLNCYLFISLQILVLQELYLIYLIFHELTILALQEF